MLKRVIVLLIFPAVCFAQVYFNLDFEGGSGRHPVGWYFPPCPGYDIHLDSTIAYAGRQSLAVRSVTKEFPPFPCLALQDFPLEQIAGKHIRLSGYVRTEAAAPMAAAAGLLLTVYGYNNRGFLSQDGATEPAPAGVRDWYPFVIDRDVSPEASKVSFGAIVIGNGTAYFDSLKIEIDGKPYLQGPDPLGRPLTESENSWLAKNSFPFTTSDPSDPAGSDFSDLQPIKKWIGDAHVIGIGESTHGTHEFSQMKHRMLEFLASKMGVTIFAVEANMPEAYRINDYVLTGNGDPKELLNGLNFWTTNTQEMLDMILWMRAYNASGQGPVQFTGFDLMSAPLAMENVRAFVTKYDPDYLNRLNTIYSQVADAQSINGTLGAKQLAAVQSAVAVAHEVVQHLDSNREAYAGASAAEIEWAVQNARVTEQATYGRTGDPNFRDAAMAQNAAWILRQAPAGTKMMLWAHDGHIRKRSGWMGGYLADVFGQDYYAISQLFHEGQYNGRYDDGKTLVPPVQVNTAEASDPGCLEYALHATGLPRLILNLRAASPADTDSAWLLGGLQVRSIGAFAANADSFVLTYTETKDFDSVIFFDQTKPNQLLPR